MNIRLAFCLVFCAHLTLSAQENLNKEVIDVVKDFRPKVLSSNKLKSQPLFVDTTKVSENLKYSIRFEDYRVQLNIDSLSAATVARPRLAPLYKRSATLGLATPFSPSLSFNISSGKNTSSMYNCALDYDANYAGDNKALQYSKIDLSANYKLLLTKYTIQSELDLAQLRRFDTNAAKYGLSGFSLDNQINLSDSVVGFMPYRFDLNTAFNYHNADKYESYLVLKSYHKGEHTFLKKWNLKNALSMQKSFDKLATHWNSELSSKRTFKGVETELTAGLDLLANSFALLPQIKAKRTLIAQSLYVYADLGLSRSLISWSKIYHQNPYLVHRNVENAISLSRPVSNKVYYARVGLVGNLFKGVNYQLSMEASSQNNYLHFVNMRDYYQNDKQWISPVFTELDLVGLNASVDAKLGDKHHMMIDAKYRSYDKHLSYVPNFQLQVNNTYDYDEHWHINTSLKYIGKRESLAFVNDISCYSEELEDINASIDIDINLKYSYQKQWSFYVSLLNLLNEDILLWEETPIMGRQLKIGAVYKF